MNTDVAKFIPMSHMTTETTDITAAAQPIKLGRLQMTSINDDVTARAPMQTRLSVVGAGAGS